MRVDWNFLFKISQ